MIHATEKTTNKYLKRKRSEFEKKSVVGAVGGGWLTAVAPAFSSIPFFSCGLRKKKRRKKKPLKAHTTSLFVSSQKYSNGSKKNFLLFFALTFSPQTSNIKKGKEKKEKNQTKKDAIIIVDRHIRKGTNFSGFSFSLILTFLFKKIHTLIGK